ncbi:MAG: hypothetical protein R2838_19590 [Caldilineaceae bacterium]
MAVGGIEVDDGYALGPMPSGIWCKAAIEEIWTPSGVLVLVDLGSAVLSAELAIDMLPLEKQPHCLVSNAPLVEGAVVATLEAA